MTGDEDRLLSEQVAFYEADAIGMNGFLVQLVDPANGTTDAVSYRAGRQWLVSFLAERAPLGRVLEIAAGGGLVAELVAPLAEAVDLLDSSDQALQLARSRLEPFGNKLRYLLADIFEFEPEDHYDLIYFTAWLHHVPRRRLAEFWRLVDRCLSPDGWVLFDFPETAEWGLSADEAPSSPEEGYAAYRPDQDISVRDVDGRRWTVVHVLWDQGALSDELERCGWTMKVERRGAGFFTWATARRTDGATRRTGRGD